MARYRALKMGLLPDGTRVREGAEFEYAGPAGAWMEKVEAEVSPLPSEPEAIAEQVSAPDEPVAESKRKGKRKETE